jgi:hypothetical protein
LELNDGGDSKFAEFEEMIVGLKAEFAVSVAVNFAEYLWNYEIFSELWLIAVDIDDDRQLLQDNKPIKINIFYRTVNSYFNFLWFLVNVHTVMYILYIV